MPLCASLRGAVLRVRRPLGLKKGRGKDRRREERHLCRDSSGGLCAQEREACRGRLPLARIRNDTVCALALGIDWTPNS